MSLVVAPLQPAALAGAPTRAALAVTANYLHEFAHDGRHLLGAPCH